VSLKLYTDKTELFECTVALEGASISDSKIRAILKFDDKNLMVEGTINSNGRGQIILPKLKNISKNGDAGIMELEVIAEDAYFQPYEEAFSVLTSKTAKVESVKTKTLKPKIMIEKINKSNKKNDFINLLKEMGITKNKMIKNKKTFRNILYSYYREANLNENFDSFYRMVMKKI
jgi:hypothetical protein